jgi:ergothioneine biosynthesis protein EgtB
MPTASTSATRLAAQYRAVRRLTEDIVAPLAPEDYVIQGMPDVSPPKWHLAHTTWFFETFVLRPYRVGYRVFAEPYARLFNSYYEGAGPFWPRPRRGLLSRPTVAEVRAYRAYVDENLLTWLEQDEAPPADVLWLVELGLHHEQQHQELLLTDILYNFWLNPLGPVFRPRPSPAPGPGVGPAAWVPFPGGLTAVGADPSTTFVFDNETPRHTVWLEPYRLARRPVTNGEFLAFVEAEGYRRPEHWLAAGWHIVQTEGWRAPLYWAERDDGWWEFTLAGWVPLDPARPVAHVSYYEADAFARWAGARLPTEAEWEHAVQTGLVAGPARWLDLDRLRPAPAPSDPSGLVQMLGDVWEWTASPYRPYPGFKPWAGTVGEYNGKFMADQWVLRGGSAFTPPGHVRPTYRNFFPASARWQCAGFRLAQDGA